MQKISFKQIIFLSLLLIIGIFIFFYKLNVIPPGFYVDEALEGYSAYSILETGRDEYGKAFPLVFRMYGSYNPPLFIYLATLPIKIWGLTIFSVRFVSAFSGFVLIFIIYAFLKSLRISTLGSLFFAITPVVVFRGRVGDEISLAFTVFSLGSFLLWLSVKKPKWFIPASFVLSLSTYAAYSQRFTVPFVLFFYFLFFRKQLLAKANRRNLFYAIVVLIFTQLPHLYLLFTPSFLPKGGETGFSNIIMQSVKLRDFLPAFLATSLSFVREFASQFVNYFSPRSLFLVDYYDLPGIPRFYQWMLIPYLIGIYIVWRQRVSDRSKYILLLALSSPITASLTKDPFPVHRAMPVLLPIFFFIALGLDKIVSVKLFSSRFINRGFYIILTTVIFFFSLILFWRSYFVLFPIEKAKYFAYGYVELTEFIRSNPDSHFVVDRARLPIPYIELAFFLKIPPEEFQNSVDATIRENYYDNPPFDQNFKFANIETRSIVWEKDIYRNQVLVGDNLAISTQQAEEHFLTKVIEIKDPLGEVIFLGYKTNPAQKCRATRNISPLCKPASTF
ncbi:hypothetical protein A2V56_00145 [Candidatus Woesebacteria bacterium RBG_19FT_COMBO_42_9]|uniref:Glycosyltransferase RgtA/B/C/D-like domain-containing protein n=1 Tax=Candidatus Woesebacteria bacterium RBG_16_42_24 TaxID=1802485 RepID=A0A1F7XKT8_9BACT|nr:MAG: hypothetical protein A2V97_00980 [Candidatus Woesebacteria bacterium RBG_16_42_24]OGM16643.1 MAG: hypothetical protein A2V56_00145 [Candidatus Woesebacteria bacterium RBG_19FT_COMBO_42_9]OGM68170.1 MAG: hypothetical protein A2985_04075 [Candidatus Woesebacteria bacterium RIFCSPLOWO2_01_FULL_43_11]